MQIKPIAFITTPFLEKFTIPRQPGLINNAIGLIKLESSFSEQSLTGIENYSHIWLIWGFNAHLDKIKKEQVRPPRLGGNKKLGVFATRSSFRPNNLGISACKLINVDYDKKQITVSGIDCLNNTPIYDIKPYLPYSDCIKSATSDLVSERPKPLFQVLFSKDSELNLKNDHHIKDLIKAVLSFDPRPAYQKDSLHRHYHTKIDHYEISWYYTNNQQVVVDNINPL